MLGQFPLDNPDNRKFLHGWRNQPGMLGLRWPFINEAQQKHLLDGEYDWLWPIAARFCCRPQTLIL